jgi:L-alanine-DL-glutamate epimerase-like enolase superfamily enzyme
MSVGKRTDVCVTSAELFLLPVQTRMPIKFGPEVLTEVTCARVRVTVRSQDGRTASGWGETPLNVQWAWPSSLSYADRLDRMVNFCQEVAAAWASFGATGHPLETGSDFLTQQLPGLIQSANKAAAGLEALPYLAALVCSSAFDVALHDAFGVLHERDIYDLYGPEHLSRDLSAFLKPASDAHAVSFANRWPAEFLVPDGRSVNSKLSAWHLVGGLDPLTEEDRTGEEPDDGYPVTLAEWITHDGLKCLKVKLRGNDQEWDFDRIVKVGDLGVSQDCTWLTADFNCTVTEPDYVNEILDRLRDEHPRLYGMLLYIEQPFPYELERDRIDARSIAARKPVFLDESAHDWQHVMLGRELGWSGVALKTCKTQTGAILSLCWARAHGMPIMVQDLANPMLAQISHLRLAAHSGTIMGVETNGMQFYPDASLPEAAVHTGMFRRQHGSVDLSSLGTTGFGFRADEIDRELPPAAIKCGDS